MAEILITMNQQDEMEMSSENGQADIDYDIDFEPSADFSHFQGEDEMLDDTPIAYDQEDIELRSATDTNDYMIDDVAQDTAADQNDGLMLDDEPQNPVDEELLDLSEDEEPDKTHNSTGEEHVVSDHAYSTIPDERSEALPGWLDQQPGSQPGVVAQSIAQVEPQVISEQVSFTIDSREPDEANLEEQSYDDLEQNGVDGGNPQLEEEPGSVGADAHGNVLADVEHTVSGDAPLVSGVETYHDFQTEEDTLQGKPEGSDTVVDQELKADNVSQKSESPRSQHSEEHNTLTGLHPTIVKYDGGRYSLFPSSEPSDGEEYFLLDENLVNSSIGDLLQACRAALGEAVTEDFELELQVDDLELFVSEDSTSAFSTSFKELLDIFVQLHLNDGVDHPPAMTVSLTTKPRFSNRLTLLENSIAEGKGVSQISSVYGYAKADDNVPYEYQDLEASEYYDAKEPQQDADNADTATDAQKIQQDIQETGAILYDDEQSFDAAQLDPFDDFDEPNNQPDNASSRTASIDEQGETSLQNETSNDQLFDLSGDYGNEDEDGDDLYEGVQEGQIDDAATGFDEAPDVTNDSDFVEVKRVPDVAKLESSGVDGDARTASGVASTRVDSIDHSRDNKVKGADFSNVAAVLTAKADNEAIDYLDEIDYEDCIEDGAGLEEVPQHNEDADKSTPRLNPKRGIDEVAGEEDQDAKRLRSL